MKLFVDGSEVETEGSVLDACRAAGAAVPTLCHDDRLTVGGHCRACIVEVDSRFVAACSTPARDGMHVTTRSPRLAAYRQDLGEMLLAGVAPRGAPPRAISALGAKGGRYARAVEPAPPDTTHPYLRIDLEACILCRLCVRVCQEVQGRFVYAVAGRGAGSRVTWGSTAFAESPCVSCGACASVCPTAAITDVDRVLAARNRKPDTTVRTTCAYCGVGCQLEVHVAEGHVVRIEGAKSPVNHAHLCVKGRYAHGWQRSPERLTRPLVRKNGALEPVSWSEALRTVADGLARNRGRTAGLSSSRCTNEENYLFQKWMRAGLGTHDVDCCARVCHGPSAAGMRRAFGTGAATNSLADLERADALLVVGSNTTESHPVTGARIEQAALDGTTLIVIDPRRTELAEIADVHLQLRPGTNVPLLNALAYVIVEQDLVDRAFVDARTEGFEELRGFLAKFTPEATESVTGVPAALVRRAALLYGRAKRPMQVHGLGVTEHYQGSESVMLLCNLAMLVGAIGREGVGVNPLRGQNNVQGAADMGCQPDALTGYLSPDDPVVRERFERVWGRALPTEPGRTLPRMYDAVRRGQLSAMVIFGEDVVHSDPDASTIIATLEKLDFLVVQEIFLSKTAELAHVVLPGAGFLEKDGTFTNGERRVQRVRKTVEPPGEAHPDWRVLCDLMAATGLPQAFRGPSDVMDEVARVAPAMFGGVSYARLEGDGLQWPVPSSDHPGTAILHATSFPRGRGAFSCVDFLPSPSLTGRASDELMLVTGRVLAHYNTGSMTRRTQNAVLVPADALEIHPDDALARGIGDGERVRVRSKFGEALPIAQLSDRVSRGMLFLSFHYPDTGTNRVTTDVVDRIAGCPEYKLTAVSVEKASS